MEPHYLYNFSRHKKTIFIIVALAAGLMLWLFDPTAYTFWPKCPFKLTTGFSCPACGIQRFIHAMACGHPLRAIRYNYWLSYALPYTILLIGTWLLPTCKIKAKANNILQNRIAVWIYIISFMAWLVVRNIFCI